MYEQALLAEQFRHLLTGAREAEKLYADLAGEVTDPALRAHVEQVRRDKSRHVHLAERLLEIVQ